MARWYEQPSLAFGDASDVTACAQVFRDVATAMSRARPRTLEVTNTGGDVWSGDSADEVRALLGDIPELLRRAGQANGDVAAALTGFAPELSEYRSNLQSLRQRGSSMADELESVERLRTDTIERLRAEEGDLEQLIAWTYTYADHPEVAPLNSRIDRLEGELAVLERWFDRNDEDFEAAVELAVDLIRSADDVLYNNGWDEFWSKTLEPVLDVVRTVLEVATVVLLVAALLGSGGTLAPLIVAGLLLAVSSAKIIGTAAAGRKVTGEMWLTLAFDLAAVATLGFAHYAKGLKVASNVHRAQADKILKGKASFHAAGQHLAKMQKIDRLVKLGDRVEFAGRMAETVEGGLVAGDGMVDVMEGDYLEGLAKIGAGAADIGGAGGVSGDLSKGALDGVGAAEGVGDLVQGSGSEREHRSPKDWPGLDGMGDPL